jgi:classical protein kinase C
MVSSRIILPSQLSATKSISQSHELDQKIQDVYKRIQTERKILEASQLMRQATKNPDVLRKNDAQIREAERGLSYFENTLRDLQAKKLQLSQGQDHTRSGSGGSSPPFNPRNARPSDRDRTLPPPPDYDRGGLPISPGPGAGFDIESGPKIKQFSNLDLIKADTPYNTAKISRMLHQLEFKLQVEMQYKKGIDKMAKLYQADGDKKSRADAESKRVESEKKIQLLQSALKRYKNLHILDDAEAEEEEGEV